MLGIEIDYTKRIYGFDLLRVFAIFFVVHGHGKHFLSGTIIEDFPWFNIPHGVDIFFVLSGFLIGYSFISSAQKTDDKVKFSKTLNFWKRSVFRILPNYYLILLINYFFVKNQIIDGSIDKFNIWFFITFTQNLFSPFYDFFWESWSLATQEWFYFSFPILLMVLGKFFKIKHTILILSLFFICLSLCYRVSINDQDYDIFWWDVSFRRVVISRIDCIFYGVIASWVRFYYKQIWNKYSIHSFLIAISLFIVISNIERVPNSYYTNLFYLSIYPIYIMLIFPILDQLKDIKTKLGKLITKISILSYAIYLLNLLVVNLFNRYYNLYINNDPYLKYLMYWTVTLILSYLLYILYEKPISNTGNRILKTSKMMFKQKK